MKYLQNVGFDGYRGTLRHEIRHYVDTYMWNGSRVFNGNLLNDESDPFAIIYLILYAINDGEINARYEELYEYLRTNKNQSDINYTELSFMFFNDLYDALDVVKNDNYTDNLSVVICLSLYTKNSYNRKYKLTVKDYNDYIRKIDLNAYNAMKKSWINKINRTIETCDKKVRKIIKNYCYKMP